MTAWWIVGGALLLLVIPAVAALAVATLSPALELKRRVDELAAQVERLPSRLEGLEELARTPLLLRDVGREAQRYRTAAGTLDRRGER